MLDKEQKKELKKICDDYTLEGLYQIINSGNYQNDIDKFEFIKNQYEKRIKSLKKKLPEYVTSKKYNIHRLTNYLCKGTCHGKSRWLEFQQPVLKISEIRNSENYTAKCLYCGSILDSHNMIICP